jgi:hypothetical protein
MLISGKVCTFGVVTDVNLINNYVDLDYFDVGVISLFYQFTLYVSLRLARRGFTLGELGLIAQGATALFMEVVNLTIARVS